MKRCVCDTRYTLNVEWRVNSHPDVDRYRLWFGQTPLNPTEVITVGGALAISVDAEVPAGTYPIVISGYNGPTKVTLTVQVTVNNVAELIFLPLVVR